MASASDQPVSSASKPPRALHRLLFLIAMYASIQALRFGSNLVLTRLLAPEILGIMALLNVVMQGLQMLSDTGIGVCIVQSKRGVSGGYRLAQPPDKIKLSVIVRHIEGALAPISCVSERFYAKCTCPDESTCGIRSVMKEVREAIVKILENTTVADVCQRVRHLQEQKLHTFEYII